MPQINEARANHTTPIRKTRRRPYRSPSEPPSRMSAASVSVSALTIHCSPDSDEPNSRPIEGSATDTAVASRNAMPDASTVTVTSHRPRAVPSATGTASLAPVTGSAGDEVGEEVGDGGDRAGGGQRDDPGDHDVAGDAPADGGEAAGGADAHDRRRRDVGRGDRDGEHRRGRDHDTGGHRLGREATGRRQLDDPSAERADDAEPAGVGAEADRQRRGEDDP